MVRYSLTSHLVILGWILNEACAGFDLLGPFGPMATTRQTKKERRGGGPKGYLSGGCQERAVSTESKAYVRSGKTGNGALGEASTERKFRFLSPKKNLCVTPIFPRNSQPPQKGTLPDLGLITYITRCMTVRIQHDGIKTRRIERQLALNKPLLRARLLRTAVAQTKGPEHGCWLLRTLTYVCTATKSP